MKCNAFGLAALSLLLPACSDDGFGPDGVCEGGSIADYCESAHSLLFDCGSYADMLADSLTYRDEREGEVYAGTCTQPSGEMYWVVKLYRQDHIDTWFFDGESKQIVAAEAVEDVDYYCGQAADTAWFGKRLENRKAPLDEMCGMGVELVE